MFASCLKPLLQNKIKPLVGKFQYDSSSYRSPITTVFTKHFKQLRSFNHTFVQHFIDFFLSPIEPTNIQPEQMDTNHNASKSSDTDNNDLLSQNHEPPEQSASTSPPSKKKYVVMKNPIFITSPVYPPLISPKDSNSTQIDDYLISILSNENCTFKFHLTTLYLHPTDYAFELCDKN